MSRMKGNERPTGPVRLRMAPREALAAGSLRNLRYCLEARKRDGRKLNEIGVRLLSRAIVAHYGRAKAAGAGDSAAAMIGKYHKART